MKLLDLPHFKEFSESRLVKVLHHKSTKQKLWELYSNGGFEKYQNTQSWDVFGNAEYIVSFIAERHKYAMFVGVWKVEGKKPRKKKSS